MWNVLYAILTLLPQLISIFKKLKEERSIEDLKQFLNNLDNLLEVSKNAKTKEEKQNVASQYIRLIRSM